MSTQYARPKWWQVYLALPLLIGLFMLDNRLRLSIRGHQVLQIGIILLVYGLIHLWIRANAKALSQMDRDQYRGTIRVIRIAPSQLPEAEDEKRRILRFPDSEIKGMLSDTFEMDYIDAESFPVEESHKN